MWEALLWFECRIGASGCPPPPPSPPCSLHVDCCWAAACCSRTTARGARWHHCCFVYLWPAVVPVFDAVENRVVTPIGIRSSRFAEGTAEVFAPPRLRPCFIGVLSSWHPKVVKIKSRPWCVSTLSPVSTRVYIRAKYPLFQFASIREERYSTVVVLIVH